MPKHLSYDIVNLYSYQFMITCMAYVDTIT